ncbi:hypothetical protein [Silvimonas amylolytica]|uniref:Type II secretion system protein GspF domain-containing protein n=1 Tax=Silvimonas amylolytica TaxID=449663 RepID=A0ABQ2PPU5_9NEIS|nr:hypothetical protein [Silvimonas amylolytica]GGP27642.1 hypothetical protein GCM10010971_34610 [Silvimonas amylolytica]
MRADPRQVALTLSDLESGTARQWYWLEIAALYPAQAASRTSQFICALLRRFGPLLCWAALLKSSVEGTGLYAPQMQLLQRRTRQVMQDAALFTAITPMLLAGFGRLPATVAFTLWLGVFLGPIWLALNILRKTPAPITPDINGTDELPDLAGPEDVVGLQAMLVATGIAPRQAGQLISRLHTEPLTALPMLGSLLPDLSPPPPTRREYILNAIRTWLAVTLPAALASAYLPLVGTLALCVLWSALTVARAGRRRAALLVLVSALLAYGFGRLSHWL